MKKQNLPSLSRAAWEELCEKERREKKEAMVQQMINYCCTCRDDLAGYFFDWLSANLYHVTEESDDGYVTEEYLKFDDILYLTGCSNGMSGDAYNWIAIWENNDCYLK